MRPWASTPSLVLGRFAHEFSGGQCQRICIARAPDPGAGAALICDEPVSALDVSIRAQILNLLEDMKARYGLTLLFIAHDLAVVKAVSDRVAVMYLGKLCEVAPTEQLFRSPAPPLYGAAAGRRSRVPDPAAPIPAHVAAGRAAVADGATERLPLSHRAVSAAAQLLQRGRTAAQGDRA